MNYFKLLELDREPFSNSPDPEFFFESVMHVQCLQQLEMALRLKRGLSVVLGPVGTGKSTICRQLLRRCGDDAKIGTHLILDPSFETPYRFLEHLAQLLAIDGPDEKGAAPDSWHLKERLKKYLFEQGVKKERITLLVIDEGQKLSPDNLELLRELLNYETNENKLLQIIIFAQEEFTEQLEAMPNFKDRVNLLYHLLPLNLSETGDMIRFRLAQAHPQGASPVRFTWPAIWLVHRLSGGYPRQIIHLCHKAVMTLIIQGRTKAGFNLVRFVGRGTTLPRRSLWRPALAGGLVLLLVAGGGLYFRNGFEGKLGSDTNLLNNKLVSDPNFPAPVEPASLTPPPEEVVQVFPLEPDRVPAPGRITIRERDTLSLIITRIYGAQRAELQHELMDLVLALNPDLVHPDRIITGQTLLFPLPAGRFGPAHGYWLELARKPDLDSAFAFLRAHENLAALRLAVARDPAGSSVYLVLFNRSFRGVLEAEKARTDFPGGAELAIAVTVFTEEQVPANRS